MADEQTGRHARAAERIDLAARVIPGGFFVKRPDAPVRTPFVPGDVDVDAPYRHCFTYAGGGSSIRAELLAALDSARRKIFVGTLFLGDPDVRQALVRAADRLYGGVYVISALDQKGLDKAINEVDDGTPVDQQTEYRNFQELTRRGIYVRGYPGLHAKFVVVDDKVALVSSANLVTRSFEQVGENGVVVTAAEEVRQLAMLFARLWHRSPYDMPPDRERHPVEGRALSDGPTLPAPDGNGPLWTWDDEHHILDAIRDVINNAERDLVLATFSIANMSHPLPRQVARPELLFEPVRRAVERGVRVRMLLRGRNSADAARAEAYAFAEAGVEIYPDRLNHAKAVIADGHHGALFSANFLTHQGLTGGVEVGMRLDGTPALAEALRYYEHVMAEVNMGFVRNAPLGEVAGSLYAEALTRWPLPTTLTVTTNTATWERLAEQQGVVLYERSSTGQTTLYSERDRWRLENVQGRWWLTLEARDDSRQHAVDIFEAWLTRERTPNGVLRGLCPVTLLRADVSVSGR
jgi:phosphatidylserine/phosphatidylglycerophosphate/cardiolipin synthase-like enzyme